METKEALDLIYNELYSNGKNRRNKKLDAAMDVITEKCMSK
jgi:hypothetical protein|tara:strand:- start:4014 stop:4136 length:123 start_codon:yes stop_codon:yes gene_type:complete